MLSEILVRLFLLSFSLQTRRILLLTLMTRTRTMMETQLIQSTQACSSVPASTQTESTSTPRYWFTLIICYRSNKTVPTYLTLNSLLECVNDNKPRNTRELDLKCESTVFSVTEENQLCFLKQKLGSNIHF